MKVTLLLIIFFYPFYLYAERSAFGAGDLDAPSPYGLTKTQKHVLKNKKTINSVKDIVDKNGIRLNALEESISGVKSIVEGLSDRSQKYKISLNHIKDDIKKVKDNLSSAQKQSKQINKRVDELLLHHDEDIKQLKLVMGELSKLIDAINGSYVSKEEYNLQYATLTKGINEFKLEVTKQLKKIARDIKNPYENKSNAEVAKIADELFKNRKYADAIDAFEYLITKKFKPARAHYYIGESYFKLDEYNNAIAYYTQSAKLYSKAKYMPMLMLHTAISFRKIKDNKHATQFFKAIVAKYPKTTEAKIAKKFL